jgi:thiol-disulfide isomerase/thioredoxin
MKLRSLLAAGIVAFSSFGASAEGISFEHISLEAALKKAKTENKPIFIDVYATWCGPCKYLTNEVFVEEELGDYMNEHFINLKLDGEKGDGDYLMVEFGLDAYPTMLYLSPDSEELNRIVGAVSADVILETSKGVIDPSTTLLYQQEQQYTQGDRSKKFLQEYIGELVEKEKDFEPVVQEYIGLYPYLNLDKEEEFLIFCIGVNDLNSDLNQSFLKNISSHNDEFPELTQAKLSILIYSICEEAAITGNNALIENGVKQLTGPLNKILDDTITEEDLRELMLETVSEV